MVNAIIVQGRVVRDPELRKTPSGDSVANFTLACERSYAKTGEERKTDFIEIVAWRSKADFVCKWFKKGQLAIVQGCLQTRKYTDKNGNTRTAYEIVAEKIDFAGGPKKQEPDVIPENDDFLPLSEEADMPF